MCWQSGHFTTEEAWKCIEVGAGRGDENRAKVSERHKRKRRHGDTTFNVQHTHSAIHRMWKGDCGGDSRTWRWCTVWYLRTHDTVAVSASSRTISSLFGEGPTHASRTALGCATNDVRPTLSSLSLLSTHSNEETAHIYNQPSDEQGQQQQQTPDARRRRLRRRRNRGILFL